MKLLDLDQGTPAWHAWRAGGIGASDVASVIGWAYAKQTPLGLWLQKTGRRPAPDLSDNYFVVRGSRFEPMARQAIEGWLALQGIYDAAIPVCVEHEQYPFIRVSLDGLLANNVPTELKVPCFSNYQAVLNEGRKSEPYLRYYPQVQDQMLATGADGAYLAFYQPRGNRIAVFEVERDERFIAQLLDAQIQWWDQYLTDTPPEMMDCDIYEPKSLVDQQEWVELAQRYQQVTKDIDGLLGPLNEFKSVQAELKDKLKALLGDHMLGEYAGLRLANSVRKGAVDMDAYLADIKSIFQLHGIKTAVPDPEKYRKDGSIQTRISPCKYMGEGVAATLKVVNL